MRSNKTVLITGAAQGIGFATAKEFHKAEYTVILSDINESALVYAYSQLPYSHMFPVNVADCNQVEDMARQVINRFGSLDVLINNAGTGYNGSLADTALDTWKRLIDINFWGPLYHINAFLPSMRKAGRGHIVNISSGQAFFRLPTWGAYATTKVALGAMSEMLHFELAHEHIKVSTVYPFMVNTGFYKDVEGETWAAKLSMKLLPYYSNLPETVGKKILKVVQNDKRVEMINPLNYLGFYSHLVPPVSSLISKATQMLLGGK